MPRIQIDGADVIALDEAGSLHRGTTVYVDGARIAGVGAPPAGWAAEQRVNAAGKILMPALHNAHCHSPMTFERGWAEDLPLDRWFNEKVWVAESALTADDVEWGAALAACEMIRCGTVSFNDHYFHMDRVAQVVERSGLKASLTWCVFGIGDDKEVGANLAGTLAFIDRWQGAADGRIRTILGPHSPYICPPEFLAEVGRIARARNLPVHIHVAESPEQVAQSLQRHGAAPVAHLARAGLLDTRAILAHGLYLDDAELDLLAGRDVTVVRCPITYMKLAMGNTPATRLMDRGVRVALGTDGPASNNDLDLLLVARTFALLEKHTTGDATAMAGDRALRCATRGGAEACGFPDSGRIEPGAAADLMLIDAARPHLRPRHDLVAVVLHGARAGDVSDVMCDGRWLMRDRRIHTLDEPTILAEAEARAKAMLAKGMTIVRSYNG